MAMGPHLTAEIGARATYLHLYAMNENHEALDYLLTNFVEVRDLINVVNHDGRTAQRLG